MSGNRRTKTGGKQLLSDEEIDSILEQMKKEDRRKKGASKKLSAAEIVSMRKKLAKDFGIDFGQPWGFSVYLIAAYGPDSNPEMYHSMSRTPPSAYGGYSAYMKAMLGPFSPKGMWTWRALSGLDLSDGLDMEAIWAARDRAGDWSSYSMNVAYDVPRFALRKSKHAKSAGSSILLASKVSLSDMKSFGGDSESGDTMEAEIHMKACEPSCVKHIFVLSNEKIGSAVPKELRELHALDEHYEARFVHPIHRHSRSSPSKTDPVMYLHTMTPKDALRSIRGLKLVKHSIPSGFKWQMVPVEARSKAQPKISVPKSCHVTVSKSNDNIDIDCSKKEDLSKILLHMRRSGLIRQDTGKW